MLDAGKYNIRREIRRTLFFLAGMLYKNKLPVSVSQS